MTAELKCRVCACMLDTTSVCYDMRKQPKLAHKFITCTDLTVSELECLPSCLCHLCCGQLEQSYAFRAKCIAADTRWRMELLATSYENKCENEVETKTVSPEDNLNSESEHLYKEDNILQETLPQTSEPPELAIKQSDEPQVQQKVIYKCDICSTQFLEEQRLRAHKRQHEHELPYPCPEPGCDRGYSHKNTLSVHMRKCHKLGKEPKLHICEFCGKVFDTMWRLKNHRFTHKDKSELPFVCEDSDCGRRFSSKQLLKVHMMRHAGIKNYKCTYCGVAKTTRTELKIHLNYHTLERAYCCRICPKVCNSSSNLKLHMRTVHERAQSYACGYCDRTFTQSALLKQHELIHTGEKPHECEECGRHFRQKGALRSHCRIHERERKDAVT
ncbi:zinc finger protein 239-like [Drosophila busckii]|uniref:zinc finger protein 239-like n=1 Tax=Drosophila busckii TaxID=30019 RepID=UPI00083F4A5E|nr:zinc finger protein 239-like [Drosophila busckii]